MKEIDISDKINFGVEIIDTYGKLSIGYIIKSPVDSFTMRSQDMPKMIYRVEGIGEITEKEAKEQFPEAFL